VRVRSHTWVTDYWPSGERKKDQNYVDSSWLALRRPPLTLLGWAYPHRHIGITASSYAVRHFSYIDIPTRALLWALLRLSPDEMEEAASALPLSANLTSMSTHLNTIESQSYKQHRGESVFTSIPTCGRHAVAQ